MLFIHRPYPCLKLLFQLDKPFPQLQFFAIDIRYISRWDVEISDFAVEMIKTILLYKTQYHHEEEMRTENQKRELETETSRCKSEEGVD